MNVAVLYSLFRKMGNQNPEPKILYLTSASTLVTLELCLHQ